MPEVDMRLVERRRDYGREMKLLDDKLDANTRLLDGKIDQVTGAVHQLSEELRAHMNTEEHTITELREHMSTTIEQPLAPVMALVDDISGFVRIAKRLAVAVKWIIVPASAAFAYLYQMGFFNGT